MGRGRVKLGATPSTSWHGGGRHTIAAFAGHLTVFGVLLVSLRATGVDAAQVSWVEALAAWGLVRLLTAIPATPGGVGIVELGLSSALVGFGANNAEAVAAVLLYRVLTVVPTLVLGALGPDMSPAPGGAVSRLSVLRIAAVVQPLYPLGESHKGSR
jgi:hypothetical protein